MNIIEKKLSEIRPYEKNPRKNDEAVKYVAGSIKEFGFKVPIVIDADGVIIAGHTRYKASRQLHLDTVPCIIADDLTEEQIKAYRLADNKVSEKAEWDMDLLGDELADILNLDMEAFGFELSMDDDTGIYDDFEAGSLKEKYIAPPFSVIQGGQKYWMDRKREWLKYIHSGDGRDAELLGSGLVTLANKQKNNANPETAGVSIFDPVLMETMLAWFCPANGKVIDPFAGGSVRGLVSAFTGREYVGMDLRQEQIDANEEAYEELADMEDFRGEPLRHPTWLCGDSTTIADVVDGEYDFMLTCPPYADLEVYSDDPRDISNMEYPQFVSTYKDIIKKATSLLKENAYAVIVIGEVRSKDGSYYNFVGDTIDAFREAGLRYYNEIIFTSPVGTGALRANRVFGTYRKVVKLHQNVLVFVKGDEKKIQLGEYTYDFPESDEE